MSAGAFGLGVYPRRKQSGLSLLETGARDFSLHKGETSKSFEFQKLRDGWRPCDQGQSRVTENETKVGFKISPSSASYNDVLDKVFIGRIWSLF
jgi:hypothetical protein